MLQMQHPPLALIRMQAGRESQIQFCSEDAEHQRQLERVRDSLLRGPQALPAETRGA